MFSGPIMKQICYARVRATVALAKTSLFGQPVLVVGVGGNFSLVPHSGTHSGLSKQCNPFRGGKGINHLVAVVEDRKITFF